MFLTYQEFKKSIILDSSIQISYDDFMKSNILNDYWNKFEQDDIRVVTCKNVEAFKKFSYEFFISRIDNILKKYFHERIECVELPEIQLLPLNVKNNKIKNSPSHIRFIRSIMNEDLQLCKNRYNTNLSILFRKIYETGDVRELLRPNTFKSFDIQNYEFIPDTLIPTIRTLTQQMSIYSPKVYNTLLRYQQKYSDKKLKNLLCPTASWGSPVIAATGLEYDSITLVDVQDNVLKKCHQIHDIINENLSVFDEPFELYTNCIPSEKMSSVDHVFFCPPYYDLEDYGDTANDQSTNLYKSYEDWLDKYWRDTVNECYKLMENNGIFSFTMNIYVNGYHIGPDMLKIAQEKFTYVDQIKIEGNDKQLEDLKKVDRYEVCYILKK